MRPELGLVDRARPEDARGEHAGDHCRVGEGSGPQAVDGRRGRRLVTSAQGLVRIDPATNEVAATIPLGTAALGDPAVVDGDVWVPKIRENAIAIVDPRTNSVARTLKVGVGPFVVTEIAGEAWIPSWKGRDIWRVRP
jgi:streptogramin lyase